MKTNIAPSTKEEIMRMERSVSKVFPKKWNSTSMGFR
jgi:hypothetical protein